MLEIYVINMAKDVVKRQHMEAACAGLPRQAEFIEAVVGVDLTPEEVGEVYAESEAIAAIGRPLSRGEIGCYLSHKKVLTKFISGCADAALVLEDDVKLSPDVPLALPTLLAAKEWDIIFLGHHGRAARDSDTLSSLWGRRCIGNRRKLVRPCERVMGTYGYLVSRKGAEKLLAQMSRVVRPVDHLTGELRQLRLLCVEKPLISIDDVMSADHHAMHDRALLKAQKKKILLAPARSSLRAKVRGWGGQGYRRCLNLIKIIWPFG